MTANDTKTLHGKDEPRLSGLVSMMDIMGASITCDNCGRWQRLGTLIPEDAMRTAKENGWTEDNSRDLCPICSKAA